MLSVWLLGHFDTDTILKFYLNTDVWLALETLTDCDSGNHLQEGLSQPAERSQDRHRVRLRFPKLR